MNPWLETIGITLIAVLGITSGRIFSRIQKPRWTLGYFLPAGIITILILARCFNSLTFTLPFSWFVASRAKFAVLCLAVTMGLTTPLSRLPYKFERAAIFVLMIIVVTWFTILPFLVPAVIKPRLAGIQTRLDFNGICYQTTDFTCGPAAAVTALNKLGISAEEGQLAILAHSNPITGTLPICLSSAIENRYKDKGVKCRYRHFDSVEQLKDVGLMLAVVKDSFLTDHCVAVLSVADNFVTIADPVFGKRIISYQQFREIWRFSGIVLKRNLT